MHGHGHGPHPGSALGGMASFTMFDGYERDVQGHLAEARARVDAAGAHSGRAREVKLDGAQDELDEVDGLLRRMDLEARGADPGRRQAMLNKVREYREAMAGAQSQVTVARAGGAHAADSEALYGGAAGPSRYEQEQLLANNDRLEQAGLNITNSRRAVLETEELGINILGDLKGQREKMEHSRDTMRVINDNIGTARRTLNTMARRAQSNKLITWGVIAMLVLAILGLLYYKFSG